MLTLPGIFQSVVKSIVKCQLSVVILTFLFSLFTLTLPPAALAAPPAPAPCQNPQSTDDLTDNYLVGEDGKPPVEYPQLRQTVSADGRVSFYFTVDFSNLQSIFGASNSDYLEGQFQDPEHKSANISELSPAEISKYHGAAQKTSPRAMLDPLKVKYVQYVNTTPTLAEAGDTFTDTTEIIQKQSTIWPQPPGLITLRFLHHLAEIKIPGRILGANTGTKSQLLLTNFMKVSLSFTTLQMLIFPILLIIFVQIAFSQYASSNL